MVKRPGTGQTRGVQFAVQRRAVQCKTEQRSEGAAATVSGAWSALVTNAPGGRRSRCLVAVARVVALRVRDLVCLGRPGGLGVGREGVRG